MTIYEKVKDLVTAREAAEHYGLTVNRNGMALCPFHDDHHPSMKLDKRFHCFACGADGDVIDLAAGLFQLSPYRAAERLIRDFGDGVIPAFADKPLPRAKPPERRCQDVLLALELQLRRQKQESLPADPSAPVSIEYAKTCQMYDYVVYLADLLSGGAEEERRQCVDYLLDGVLARYEKALQRGVIKYEDIF